ncbi:prolyl oligopeptidase family serine peptidase [Gemmatimonas groenlandica]|uniref:prolyl oligopeptidase n=1 Tax=Gemmatimonas groenlandica TaxID=2732249 RepID=A0A6M4IM58_9BACT|nr:prolyl oligopeptidase family serine peptidase [Gemmatimonas groenlandica]QJR34557.1 S9 family peptidase [Gemmatimonas groenlandica]
MISSLEPERPTAPPTYPATRTVDQVDDYHGNLVADPFRWLEDDTSAETKGWVEAQNRVTFAYLDRIPSRDLMRARLTELVNYPRYSAPVVKKQWHLFTKNDGLQNQAVYYIQEGAAGTPVVLIDPNSLSADGTTRVAGLTFNKAGTRIAYMLSQAGSDWQQIRVIDVATRENLPDVVDWVKVSGIAWHGDGFFYSRYPEPVNTDAAFSSVNEDHQVFYHALGTPQSSDRLVYRDSANPQRFHTVGTTESERYAVLSVSDRGQGKDGNALHVLDLTVPNGAFSPLWTTFDDQMDVLDNVDDQLLVITNRHAPNQRVVRIDPAAPDEANWITVIAERTEPVSGMSTAGGRLFATYLKDVTTRAYVHALDGTVEREITLPGFGTAGGFDGEHDATSVYYSFTSFTAPITVYRYDIVSGRSTQLREVTLPFDPDRFETRQVFVTSKDGTKVPAFIVARKGLVLDGANPTMLYAYGGFNVSLPPNFSAMRVAFLEQGGVYVQANLRGGNEYGEAWHQAGMKEKKQNVFDDFVAVAEWLFEHGYTCSDKLAIAGGSNGGLLVGAIMTQRPTLAKVALPAVGVMDMLRFHKFTIGWNWIADYGSSDDVEGFDYLFAYSPLHNLKDGTAYPATLITTADHDDRVVPAHSFKFAARLQQAHDGPNPVLIRIETQSGHGSSSLTKQIAEMADEYAFIFENLGVTPEWR